MGSMIGNVVGGLMPGGNSGGMLGGVAGGFGKAAMAQGDKMGMDGLREAEGMQDKADALGKASNALAFKGAIQTMVREMIKAAIQNIPKG